MTPPLAAPPEDAPPTLVYALYQGNLYGTERMALATAAGLQARGAVARILAPEGLVHEAARQAGLRSCVYRGAPDLLRQVDRLLACAPALAFLGTRLEHSLALAAANLRRRRPVKHWLVVHGGGGKNVYRRNRLLAPLDLGFIAVSPYVRRCLIDNGIPSRRITVAENFMARSQRDTVPRRALFTEDGVRRVALISRLEAPKRLDLLLSALQREPGLAGLRFDVFGDGSQRGELAALAARLANVRWLGFQPDAAQRLHEYDLLLHTAPHEPFGLVLLEAMAAGVPVLVPDAGGPADIAAGGAGRLYRAGDAADLARQLSWFASAPASALASQVERGRNALEDRFGDDAGLDRYAALLDGIPRIDDHPSR